MLILKSPRDNLLIVSKASSRVILFVFAAATISPINDFYQAIDGFPKNLFLRGVFSENLIHNYSCNKHFLEDNLKYVEITYFCQSDKSG